MQNSDLKTRRIKKKEFLVSIGTKQTNNYECCALPSKLQIYILTIQSFSIDTA